MNANPEYESSAPQRLTVAVKLDGWKVMIPESKFAFIRVHSRPILASRA